MYVTILFSDMYTRLSRIFLLFLIKLRLNSRASTFLYQIPNEVKFNWDCVIRIQFNLYDI